MIIVLEDGLCYMDYSGGNRVLPDANIKRDQAMTVGKCQTF